MFGERLGENRLVVPRRNFRFGVVVFFEPVAHSDLDPIVNAVGGEDRPLVRGDGLGNRVTGRRGAEHRFEFPAILRLRPDADDGGVPGFARPGEHFQVVLDRTLRLIFQRRGPTVPELKLVVRGIHHRRALAPPSFP